MAITTLFTPHSMNATQYDEIVRQLDSIGATTPPGRLYHLCFGTGDKLRVLDVWESQEAFQAFGPTLMPILQRIGVDPGQPEISPLHHSIPS